MNERKVRFAELRTLRPRHIDEKVVVEKDGEGANGLYAYNGASRSWGRVAVKDVNGQWQAPKIAKQIVEKQTVEAAEQVKDNAASNQIADSVNQAQVPAATVEPVAHEPAQVNISDQTSGDSEVLSADRTDEKPGEVQQDGSVQDAAASDNVTEQALAEPSAASGTETEPVGRTVINHVDGDEVKVVEGSDDAPFEPETKQPSEVVPVQDPVPPPQPQSTVQQKIAAAKLKLSQSAFTKR
jgi:hypothetical protein